MSGPRREGKADCGIQPGISHLVSEGGDLRNVPPGPGHGEIIKAVRSEARIVWDNLGAAAISYAVVGLGVKHLSVCRVCGGQSEA